jgi:phage protein D
MADPAESKARFTPDIQVKVDGNFLPQEIDADIVEVMICDHVSGASWFCVNINMWDSNKQEFKYIDDKPFKEGAKLEVRFGYDETSMVSLIKGEVTTLEPEFSEDGAHTLKVEGYDSLHRFRRGKKTRSYLKQKDSDIARKIASELGLTAQVEDTGIQHEYLLQNNLSDIDFLSERARRIRYELAVEDGNLIFRKAANNKEKVVTLELGLTLRCFYPRLSTASQVSEVAVQGWDMKTKKAISGRARSGDEVSKMGGQQLGASITESAFFAAKNIIIDKPIFSEGEANQIAKGKFNDMAVGFITGEGTAIGNIDIRAGRVIELLGLGKRFSGFYYVTSATHALDQAGYATKFTVERNAT